AELIKRHARTFKIKLRNITFYNSQANGISERIHQTMNGYIKHYVKESKYRDWDKHLHIFQYVYNTTAHKGIKNLSPFQVVYGRKPRLPNDYKLSIEERRTVSLNTLEKFEEIWKLAHRASQIEKDNANKALNKNRRDIEFQINDVVTVSFPRKTEVNQNSKWVPHYTGRYKIIQKQDNLIYVVRDINSGREFKTHVKRLRLLQ